MHITYPIKNYIYIYRLCKIIKRKKTYAKYAQTYSGKRNVRQITSI